ncbi:alpha/beta fold hydrolase [Baekduia alba]|uniref:alpha/beta fold hydrolase n=1 Tax=Baekduia alba TaxID=2997333 RepID=UPI002341F425|nr:alpha/beta hydrolase [Baekduia alba]
MPDPGHSAAAKPALARHLVGEGSPILCLHSYATNASFAAQCFEPALHDAPHQRIYLDLPGSGDSPPVEPTSESVLEAVLRVVDEELDGSIAIAGHSYGGYLAAALARRRPDRVKGLLLVCHGVRILPAERTIPADAQSVPAPVQELLDALPQPHGDYLRDLRANGYQLADERSEHSFAGPVAAIVGRQDGIAGYVDQFEQLQHFPDGTYTALAGAGHYLPLEQPDALALVAREWLARLGA